MVFNDPELVKYMALALEVIPLHVRPFETVKVPAIVVFPVILLVPIIDTPPAVFAISPLAVIPVQ